MAQSLDFMAASLAKLAQDDILNKLIGVKLMSDNTVKNDLLGAAMLTGSSAAKTAAIIDMIGDNE